MTHSFPQRRCSDRWGISWGGEPSVGETKGRSHRPVSRDRRRGEIGSAIHLLWVQRRDRTDAQTATALWKRYVITLSNLARPLARSEEHTSELQSLMRISYAVFCLQKKKEHN